MCIKVGCFSFDSDKIEHTCIHWDNSITTTGNTPTVDAPTVNTPTINSPTEKWGRGAMTTEVKSYIELREM